MKLAIVVVDHGSRREASNEKLAEVTELLKQQGRYEIVEPAHMEIAEPSIDTAVARAVEQGAERIVVCPFFLFPGQHWHEDIPRLARAAVARFPGVELQVAAPLGVDARLVDVLDDRIQQCLSATG